jgi:hypothetical protein
MELGVMIGCLSCMMYQLGKYGRSGTEGTGKVLIRYKEP